MILIFLVNAIVTAIFSSQSSVFIEKKEYKDISSFFFNLLMSGNGIRSEIYVHIILFSSLLVQSFHTLLLCCRYEGTRQTNLLIAYLSLDRGNLDTL